LIIALMSLFFHRVPNKEHDSNDTQRVYSINFCIHVTILKFDDH
jgi:hypothetical protein